MTHKEQNDIALARIVEQLDLLGQLQREVAADRAGRTALINPVSNKAGGRRPKYEPIYMDWRSSSTESWSNRIR
jgi:hypothetical protein